MQTRYSVPPILLIWGSVKFTSGENVSDILLSIFARDVMLQVTDVSSTALSFRFAVAKEVGGVSQQDMCYRTLEQSDVLFDTNPLFTFDTDLLEFDAFAAMLRLRNLSLGLGRARRIESRWCALFTCFGRT